MCKQEDEEAPTEAGLEVGLKIKPLGESKALAVVAEAFRGGVKECCLELIGFSGVGLGEMVARLEIGLELEHVVMELRGVLVELIDTELGEAIGKLKEVLGMSMGL